MRLEKTLYIIVNPCVYAANKEAQKLKASYQNTIQKVKKDLTSYLFLHFDDLFITNNKTNIIYKNAKKILDNRLLTTSSEIKKIPIIAKIVAQGEYWTDALGMSINICQKYNLEPDNFDINLEGSLIGNRSENRLYLLKQESTIIIRSLTPKNTNQKWENRIKEILEERLSDNYIKKY